MSGLVAAVQNAVPAHCQSSRCSKDRCSVSMKGAPPLRVIIDMDCTTLVISGSRCDYVFISEDENSVWVAPIELKSGEVKASNVEEQLQGGAQFARQFFTAKDQFNFVPVLAHGKSVHRLERNKLRQARIRLRGKIQQPVLIRCGDPITKALATGT